MFEEEWDPYAVTPEDALYAARQGKRWRLEQLTQMKAKAELDGPTSWFVLHDAFQAPVFPYDGRSGVRTVLLRQYNKKDIVGILADKKASNWRVGTAPSGRKGALDRPTVHAALSDAIHHAANLDVPGRSMPPRNWSRKTTLTPT